MNRAQIVLIAALIIFSVFAGSMVSRNLGDYLDEAGIDEVIKDEEDEDLDDDFEDIDVAKTRNSKEDVVVDQSVHDYVLGLDPNPVPIHVLCGYLGFNIAKVDVVNENSNNPPSSLYLKSLSNTKEDKTIDTTDDSIDQVKDMLVNKVGITEIDLKEYKDKIDILLNDCPRIMGWAPSIPKAFIPVEEGGSLEIGSFNSTIPRWIGLHDGKHSELIRRVKPKCLNETLQGPFFSPTGIHIITSFYKGSYKKSRFKEIIAVLERNLKNRNVVAVHALWEDVDPIEFVSDENLKRKLVRVAFGVQPTYKDLFDYANLYLNRGNVAIITNSDIYFDQTLSCVVPITSNRANFYTRRREVYALSRHPSPNCSGHDMCEDYIGSHDSFMFAPPLPPQIAKGLDFKQNHLSAENVVIWELKQAPQVAVRNPCHVIYAKHLHCTRERHYNMVRISHGPHRIGDRDRHSSQSPSHHPRCKMNRLF